MTGRRSPRGLSMSPASFSADTRADLFPLPPGSIHRDPLKSSQIREAALDVLKFFSVLAFITATAFALTAGFFLLLVDF